MRKVVNIKRTIAAFAATVLAGVALTPALSPQAVSAYGLITDRQVKMSSSALGATSVSYYVEFKPETTGTVKSIALDFCQNSPILGDTCTATVGTNTPTLSTTVDTTTANVGNIGASWTAALTNSNRTLTLTKSAGVAVTAGVAYYFTVSAITNPTDMDTVTGGSQVGSFYARILTFPNDATSNYADAYTGSSANLASNVPTDAGGVALSTASQVTIQSKVQERLTFCIYTGSGPCPGSMTNPVTLGDSNGVLDPAVSYTTSTSANGNPKFGLSSNAGGGVVVRMKGGTLKRTPGCADGTGQNCSINPIGGTAAAPATGSEQFGVRLLNPGATITASAPYTAAGNYAFDDNNTDGTQSTYGDQIASMAAAAEESSELQFVGNVAATTESGIYTTTLTFIATGTY